MSLGIYELHPTPPYNTHMRYDNNQMNIKNSPLYLTPSFATVLPWLSYFSLSRSSSLFRCASIRSFSSRSSRASYSSSVSFWSSGLFEGRSRGRGCSGVFNLSTSWSSGVVVFRRLDFFLRWRLSRLGLRERERELNEEAERERSRRRARGFRSSSALAAG